MIRIILAALGCLIAETASAQSIVTSTTAGRAPTATEIAPGQILINRADGVVYYIDATGVPRAGSLVLATTTGRAAITAANAAALATAAGLGPSAAATFGSVTTPGQFKGTAPAGGSASALLASSNAPAVAWQVTGQASDQANWDAIALGTSLYFRAVNDANGAATNWLSISRGSGYTITSAAFGVPALLRGYTVAGLPACTPSLKGALVHVTDATSPTYNGALTGGGTVAVPAFCNGAVWTAH